MNIAKPGRIRAAILSWLGKPFGLTDTGALADLFGGRNVAGVNVNHESVLTISAAWACTRLISETISTLPLSLFEKTSAGKRQARQHPLNFIIHDQPNPDSTAAVFWEAVVAAMLLRGNARCEKLMAGGRLVGLRFLNPNRLWIGRDAQGAKQYRYTEDGGRQRVIPSDRIWNVPGFSLDGKDGVSVICYGARVFGSALAADTAAATTFANGLMPTVYVKYPKVLQPAQREAMRDALEKISGATRAGKPAVLEAESDIGTIGINPNEAQMLESRGFSVEEVCRGARRITILENVVNPTNVGAIFRSAAALHMDAVLLTGGCSDPLYRRAARVSMGTVFQIPWTYFDKKTVWPAQGMEQLREIGFKTVAMALRNDSVEIDDPGLKSQEKLAIILGTEGEGLLAETMEACDYTVKIPMSHGVDSLNVAAASAVAFWELGR